MQKRLHILNDNWIISLLGISTVGIYLSTLAPTVRFWDSAQLVSAGYALGIPFAPGFPLYIILNKMLINLGLFSPPVTMNLFSAFCATFSSVILLVLIRELNPQKRLSLGAILGWIFFTFGSSVWIQANRTEVYAFNTVLLLISILLAVKYRKDVNFRYGIGSIYFWGLSAVTHTASAGAAFLPILIMTGAIRKGRYSLNLMVHAIIVLAIALSANLFIPIRSALNPSINWGRCSSFADLWDLISAKQFAFSVNLQGGVSLSERLLTNYKSLSANFPLFLFPFIILGLWFLRKDIGFIFLFILGELITLMRQGLPYSDHLGYLIISVIPLAIWLSFGFDVCWRYMKEHRIFSKPASLNIIMSLLLIVLTVPFLFIQHKRNDLHNNHLPERLGREILDSVPDSAIILYNDISSNAICRYLQVVHNFRTDCVLLIPGYISGTSHSREWYIEGLKEQTNLTGLDSLPENEIGIIASIIEDNHRKHSIFMEYGEFARPFAKYLKPQGLLFKFTLENDTSAVYVDDYRFPSKKVLEDDWEAILAYSERLFVKGLYYSDVGESAKAQYFYQISSDYLEREK